MHTFIHTYDTYILHEYGYTHTHLRYIYTYACESDLLSVSVLARQVRQSRSASTASPARLERFGTGARGLLARGSASSAESALPARTAWGVSQASREAARRASQANTRQPRGQQRATHARLFQRASPGLTASTVAETLKGPAQGAEAARLEGTGSSAPRSRQDDALHVCQARTRPAPDPSPA